MRPQYAIAWRADDGIRFVGLLAISPSHVQIEGTSTASDRERRHLQFNRADISRATLERAEDLAAVHIQTADDSHIVELLTGGRGMALELLDNLRG